MTLMCIRILGNPWLIREWLSWSFGFWRRNGQANRNFPFPKSFACWWLAVMVGVKTRLILSMLTRTPMVSSDMRGFRKRNWLAGMREQEFQLKSTTT